jgi:hypothetical protein
MKLEQLKHAYELVCVILMTKLVFRDCDESLIENERITIASISLTKIKNFYN